MTQTYRPGVYSRYQVTYSGTSKLPKTGIFCCRTQKQTGAAVEQYVPVKIENESCLEELFTKEENPRLWRLALLWLEQGVGLWLLPATVDGSQPEEADYAAALAKAQEIKDAACLLCDSGEEQVLLEVKAAVEQALRQQREWLGFGFCSASDAPGLAAALNSERMVLCCQKASAAQGEEGDALFTCAAFAARILALSAPNDSLSGLPLPGIGAVEALGETEVEALLAAGVTVFEEIGGAVECICGVTTKTKAQGGEDRSLGAITTVLMIDHVMQAVRARLKGLLQSIRTDRYTLGAIETQAAVALGEEQDLGLVESFQSPQASRDKENPSTCHVLLRFALAVVVSQIWITAEITV